jgi:alanine dehydrogenase
MKIRILSADDVRQALNMGEAIEAMKGAFIQLSTGKAVMPVRGEVSVSKHGGVSLFMPAYLSEKDEMAIKIVSVFNDNPAKGLPLIHGLIVVLDATTGKPEAVMDGTYLTAFRTGAASGAATDYLARKDSSSVLIIGAGVQGRTQLQAVSEVRHLEEVWVYDIQKEHAQEFAAEMGKRLSLDIQVVDQLGSAVQEADIICTATTSSTPVFDAMDVKSGTHINAVGAYTPQMQEVPSETVARSKIVIDDRESSMAEAGDLLITIKEGMIGEDDIFAELGEIVAGIKPSRENKEEITLFKSVGVAVQDVAIANLVLSVAKEMNLGAEFEL